MTMSPKSSFESLPPAEGPMTLEEFMALGEGPPFFEFEDGYLIPRNGGADPMVSPKSRHQKMLFRLMGLLDQYVAAQRIGEVVMEVDVYLPDGNIYIPNITFVALDGKAHLDPIDDKVHGVPEMVVEILSDDVYRDRVHKSRVYQRSGVAWYWIIDPESLTLEEYHFLPDGTTTVQIVDKNEDFQPALFPGLTLNLTALMGELPAPKDV